MFSTLGLPDQVLPTLREAARVHPTEGSFHFSLIVTLQRSGQTQEAITCNACIAGLEAFYK